MRGKRWAVACAAAVGFGLAGFVPGASGEGIEQTTRREYVLTGPGTVTVKADLGAIRVVPGDEPNKVVVVVVCGVKAKKEEEAKLVLDRFTLDITRNDNDVFAELEYDAPRGGVFSFLKRGPGVTIDVTVPLKCGADLMTGDGSISVSRLIGDVRAVCAGGPITLDGIRGDVSALAAGGEVQVKGCSGSLSVAGSDATVKISDCSGTLAVWGSGRVELDGVGGTLHATSSGGDLIARIRGTLTGDSVLSAAGGKVEVYVDAAARMKLNARAAAGSIVNQLPVTVHGEVRQTRLTGAINGGGPELLIRTVGGSISLRGYSASGKPLPAAPPTESAPTSAVPVPKPAADAEPPAAPVTP